MRGRIPPPGPGERDTIVDGVRWRSREVEGVGEPVVYVPGIFASSAVWQDVLGRAAGGRPAIAVDLPGSGYSDRPWPWDYSVPGLTRALISYLDTRGIARAVLVGNSLGGAIVMLAAVERPDRVAALVLVAPATAESRIPWTLSLLRVPIAGGVALGFLSKPLVAWGQRHRLYADPSRVTPRSVDDAWRPMTVPGTRRAAILSIRSPRRPHRGIESRIRVPTLIVWGREDRILSVREAARLASRIAGSRLVVLDGAGHMPQREAPEAFIRAMTEFLEEKIGRPPGGDS